MAFTPFSARNASIRINNVVFVAKHWEVKPKTAPADVTNFEGGGYGDAIGTILEADVDIDDADMDATAMPYNNPPNLIPTTFLENVFLYMAGVASPFWNFPSMLVTDVPNRARVREAMKFSVRLYGKGQFAFPSGVVNVIN